MGAAAVRQREAGQGAARPSLGARGEQLDEPELGELLDQPDDLGVRRGTGGPAPARWQRPRGSGPSGSYRTGVTPGTSASAASPSSCGHQNGLDVDHGRQVTHGPLTRLGLTWGGVVGRVRRAMVAALLGLALAGCATFPDEGPRDWRDKLEERASSAARRSSPSPRSRARPHRAIHPGRRPCARSGCEDPDPQVVATCLEPVGAIAVLPDARAALVGERATGRILRVQRDLEPQLVTTVAVDASGGGGLPGSRSPPATPRTSSSTPTSRRRRTTGWSGSRRASRPSPC